MASSNNTESKELGVLLVIGLLIQASDTMAYEVQPNLKFISQPGHEIMTEMAAHCAMRSPIPTICIEGAGDVQERRIGSKQPQLLAVSGPLQGMTISELMVAVQWSDDPVRSLGKRRQSAALKSGFLIKKLCKKRYSDSILRGLLCSSHLGPLQFLHAMASKGGEPYEETRRKILQWSEFAYSVAINEINLDDNYCEYFRKMSGRRPEFSAAMLPPQEERNAMCQGRNPWTIRTLFNWECNRIVNTLSFGRCHQPQDTDMRTRLAALGSILHLVQDSYSHSHVSRGTCDSPEKPREPMASIVCQPTDGFLTYADQASGLHRKSDQLPRIDESCLSPLRSVDDPITASARLIWLAAQGESAENAVRYLASRVFPESKSVEQSGEPLVQVSRPASAGECYHINHAK
jgi:hypothetical protein